MTNEIEALEDLKQRLLDAEKRGDYRGAEIIKAKIKQREQEVCIYPKCNCAFDKTDAENTCLRGLKDTV